MAYIICPLFVGYHQKYGKVTDPFSLDLSGHARCRYVADSCKTGAKQQLSQVLAVEAMMKYPRFVAVERAVFGVEVGKAQLTARKQHFVPEAE